MNDLTLYQIKDEYVNALSVLNDMDLDEQEIKDSLSVLKGDLEDKCESVAMWRANQLVVANAKTEAAKKLIAQAKAIENRAENMIDYLDTNMRVAGITEISCDLFTIKYKKNPPSLCVLDEDKIPDDFKKEKTTISVDKNALKKAMQDGLECEGAEVVQGEVLVIK